MNTHNYSHTTYNPILIGFFTLLVTIALGMSLAFVAGLTTPERVFAQLAPPCCTVPPPPPPPAFVVPPPPPPPPPPPAPLPPPPVIVVIPPPPVVITPILGCMDPAATNYNPAATSQVGITCTYPLVVVLGCMDPAATNYNPAATSQAGITCTYPGGGGGGGGGGAGGPPPTGGAGGGGGVVTPTIVLSVLPHIGLQPLAYLYLSQIPYTGLDLGPVGTTVYWFVLIGLSALIAYFTLFGAVPFAHRSFLDFSSRIATTMRTIQKFAPVAVATVPAGVKTPVVSLAVAGEAHREAPHGYSSYHGFKSFARNGALSVEDIVKGLARKHPAPFVEPVTNTEPVYDTVEPVYENVEPVVSAPGATPTVAPADARGLTTALVEGDRTAVFAGLRQQVRGGGAPEQLIFSMICLLDDTYRARVDGSSCDETFARLTARIDTPTLERVITALATAIDSSYSDTVTGAKLALTRALAVLGA